MPINSDDINLLRQQIRATEQNTQVSISLSMLKNLVDEIVWLRDELHDANKENRK